MLKIDAGSDADPCHTHWHWISLCFLAQVSFMVEIENHVPKEHIPAYENKP